MTLSNLPPGVQPGDIPGNRPEDLAFDALYDQIALSGLTAEEAKRRWDSQPALLEALRDFVAMGQMYGWDKALTGRQLVMGAASQAIAKAERS